MKLEDVINEYSSPEKSFELYEYFSAVTSCEERELNTLAYQGEVLAAALTEGKILKNDPLDGLLYYGPNWVTQGEDGSLNEAPDRRNVSIEIIDYWKERSEVCDNPILKARYSGLAFDFTVNLFHKKKDISLIDRYITAVSNILKTGLATHKVFGIQLAERAVTLALHYKRHDQLVNLKKDLHLYASCCGDDSSLGIWAAPLRISQEIENSYTNEEKKALISEAEIRFDRVRQTINGTNEEHSDPWLLQRIGEFIMAFYAKSDQVKVQQVLDAVEQGFDKTSMSMVKLQKVGIYSELQVLATRYNCVESAKRLTSKIAKFGEGIQDHMMKTEHSFTIQQADIDAVVNSILYNDTDASLGIFANRFIPQKEQAKKHVKEIAKSAPFLYLVKRSLFDYKGRVKAQVGGIDEDMQGQVLLYLSQTLTIESIFLSATIDEGINRGLFTVDKIVKFLEVSPAIENAHIDIIKNGLDLYFAQNYIAFIHVIIPQIEAGIRHLLDICEVPTMRIKKLNGGFNYCIMNELIANGRKYSIIPDEIADYFEILYTDNRGWNLRNDVCHGIVSPRFLHKRTADRVLHSLICLGAFHYVNA